MIYFDNAATTRACKPSVDAVLNAMQNDFGNPSSLYNLGLKAENIVTDSAKLISNFISCDYKEILFTSGATESNNLALLGGVLANKRMGKKVIISAIEHPSIYETAHSLEKEGFEIVEIFPRSDGILYPEDFINAVDNNTIIVSCMLVNNETGGVFPVEQIAKGVRKKSPKVLIHTDAVQAFGKIPVNVNRLSVDLMSISGHKIYGPKGIGALYIKRGTKIKPLLFGGGQQNNMRVGTEPVPQIAGFAAAVEYCKNSMQENFELYTKLKEHFIYKTKNIKDIEIIKYQNDVPYIINISVKGLKSEVLLHFLEQYEIYVSSGSACSKGKKSRVLNAFNLSDNKTDTSLRISFCPENNLQDIDKLIEYITLGINTLAKLR